MSDRKQDWDRLRDLWQAPPERTLPDLTAQLARRTRRIWLLTALDLIGTVLILAAVAWAARDGLDAVERWYTGFVVVLLAVGWPLTLAARRGSWRLDDAGPQAVLEFAIRRCTASIRLARINQGAILVGIAAGFVLALLDAPPANLLTWSEETRWIRRLAAAALFLGWFGGAEWYARRKHLERERLRRLREECRDP